MPAGDHAEPYADFGPPNGPNGVDLSLVDGVTGPDGRFRVVVDLSLKPAGYEPAMYGDLGASDSKWIVSGANPVAPESSDALVYPAQNGGLPDNVMPRLTPGTTWVANPIGFVPRP